MAAVAAEGTQGADDDRANEANVATVAAGDTAGAEGAVSDVSSEEFCQGRREDPLAAADNGDATHGDDAAELDQLVAMISISGGRTPSARSTHGGGDAPDIDLHQRVAEREWNAAALARNEADRRALAAAGNGPWISAAGLAVMHEVAQSRSRA